MNRDEFYDALAHHGIKGQKWGVRRYQNDDGSLTAEGEARKASARGNEKRGLKTVLKATKKANKSIAKAETAMAKAKATYNPVKEARARAKYEAGKKFVETSAKVMESSSSLTAIGAARKKESIARLVGQMTFGILGNVVAGSIFDSTGAISQVYSEAEKRK